MGAGTQLTKLNSTEFLLFGYSLPAPTITATPPFPGGVEPRFLATEGSSAAGRRRVDSQVTGSPGTPSWFFPSRRFGRKRLETCLQPAGAGTHPGMATLESYGRASQPPPYAPANEYQDKA